MARLKRNLVAGLTGLLILAGLPLAAAAVDISDYTAFPPFLPRVVSPNILFMLDYSESMVQPAYGECSSDLGDCKDQFLTMADDYNSATTYEGYFDSSANYTCAAGGQCTKSTAVTGVWKGNWLNWLTTTQFDVLKKVVVGGDVDPAPEQGAPNKLRSRLSSGVVNEIYKVVKKDTCTANTPNTAGNNLCNDLVGQRVPYRWIPTPASPDYLFGRNIFVTDTTAENRDLPFPFTFYGTEYTKINISENGYVQFTNTADSIWGDWSNDDIPNATAPNNMLAVFWDDLIVSSSSNSFVAMFTVGTAPNRVCVVTYEDIYPYNTTAASGVSFQVLLFEGSNHIVFQYKDVDGGPGTYLNNNTSQGVSATIGLENVPDLLGNIVGKKYSYNGSRPLANNLALLMTPGYLVYSVTPADPTRFQPAAPLADSTGAAAVRNDFNVNLALSAAAEVDPDNPSVTQQRSKVCPDGYHLNNYIYTKNLTSRSYTDPCFNHKTEGLLQDFRDGELAGLLGFRLGIMGLVGNDGGQIGGSSGKHFNDKDETGWSSLMSSTRGQTPTVNAPLAEAMYGAIGYFKEDTAFRFATTNWSHHAPPLTSASCSGTNYDPYCFLDAGQPAPCAKSYVLLVSSGNYSHDKGTNIYNDAINAETWTNDWTLGTLATDDSGAMGTRANGGWLDNVAYKAHTTDWRSDLDGTQSITLYAVNTFSSSSSPGAAVLKKAATYGGFEDLDDDDVYDAGEDDLNGDGLPDNYFAAGGGGGLKSGIVNAVLRILQSSASGTSVSVLSTSAGGEGALYQAYFFPSKVDAGSQGEDRKWPGFLRGFFIDRYQNLRDDYSGGASPYKSLVLNNDRVVRMELNTNTNRVNVFFDLDGNGDGDLEDAGDTIDATPDSLDDIVSLWEAGETLAKRDKSERNIYLWLDKDGDNNLEGGGDFSNVSVTSETLKLSAGLATTLKPYLRAQTTVYDTTLGYDADTDTLDDKEAENLVNFIIGQHVNKTESDNHQLYRNRCVTVGATETGCGANQSVWPLGDVVFSTPTLVGIPGERYHKVYGDATYANFAAAYKNRRQLVFVGANDGLLHAFNAGIYHEGDDSTTSSTTESGWFTANPADMTGSAWASDPPALGDEVWAFLPYDNLPHMAWLACNGSNRDPVVCGDAEYTHVYYVDARPKVTDVQIFNHGSVTTKVAGQSGVDHTDGWGTILILSMRLGGGAMDVNYDFDGDSFAETRPFRSAYYVLDITDPEKPPKLLWRFTDTYLGFTTSYPGIVRIQNATIVPPIDTWYMVVGSGPQNTTAANGRDYDHTGTAQNGRIFVVDLSTGQAVRTIDTGKANSIMGDPTVIDVDLDFSSDVIYIGSAVSTTSGRIYRINTLKDAPANWVTTTLYDPDPASNKTNVNPDNNEEMGPLFVGPSAAKDSLGRLWVFFGTGRLKSKTDLKNYQQQRFYGIRDECWKTTSDSSVCPTVTYSLSNLVDTTNIEIEKLDGSNYESQVNDPGSLVCPGSRTDCNFNDLVSFMRNSADGWRRDLYKHATDVTVPSERVVARSSVLGGIALFTTYIPSEEVCSIYGDSYLYGVYYETGTAFQKPIFPDENYTKDADTATFIGTKTSLGYGMPTSVGLAVGETVSGFIQKSTGAIEKIEQEPGLQIRSGVSGWRENEATGGAVEIETIYKHIVK